MTIIVRDDGFHADDQTDFLDLASDTDPATLDPSLAENIRIAFPSSADGRGFSLARILRLQGFTGRLRAAGHVLSDQYTMARRCGFDEVEISDELADRQPAEQWLFRADWRAHDYQARMRG
ncbi:DUF934 domain-containing protein [Sagittula sp. NFXS13]|uniref:DUF934 domain-containing protein n=1 Tax=Sagittula sp. NFXS13 TaxID=2819095 RepID=UPI0032DF7740